jgi:hypothetical protein
MTTMAGLAMPTTGTAPEPWPDCEGFEEPDPPVGLDVPAAPPVAAAEPAAPEAPEAPEAAALAPVAKVAEGAPANSCAEEKVWQLEEAGILGV